MGSPFGVRKKLRELQAQINRTAGMASGSAGAQRLQKKFDSGPQARDFYKNRVYDHVRPHMFEYIARRREVFLASADSHGDADCSVKMGRPGFMRVLDEKTLAMPLYSGNGVHASLGNISENAQIGLCFYSPEEEFIAYQVNGRADIVERSELAARNLVVPDLEDEGRHAVRWLIVRVRETFARCNRHRIFVDEDAEDNEPPCGP